MIVPCFSGELRFHSVTTMERSTLVGIVEDDDLARHSLQGLIEVLGVSVLAFASAEDFLASGTHWRTGCLITDLRLPGISGLDLQARLNKEHCVIPIIFITAHGDEDMRMQALRAGAVEFLTKPVDGQALLHLVRAALSIEDGSS